MIWWKTLVITYQPKDYFSNDSHNLSLYLHNGATANKYIQLFLVATLSKSLKPRYTRGDSVSKKKIQSDVFLIPVRNQEVDFEFMETFIRAVEKLVIKDLIQRSDKKMSVYNKVVKW